MPKGEILLLVEPCRLEWYMEKVSYLLSILQGLFETSHLGTAYLFQVLGYTVTMLTISTFDAQNINVCSI